MGKWEAPTRVKIIQPNEAVRGFGFRMVASVCLMTNNMDIKYLKGVWDEARRVGDSELNVDNGQPLGSPHEWGHRL